MKIHKLKNMKQGWLIGDFDPAAIKAKDFEFAIKEYKAGDVGQWHYHKVAKELTVIISGEVQMCDQKFTKGDIITLDPGEGTEFYAVTDVVTACVKIPSVKNDKFTE